MQSGAKMILNRTECGGPVDTIVMKSIVKSGRREKMKEKRSKKYLRRAEMLPINIQKAQ